MKNKYIIIIALIFIGCQKPPPLTFSTYEMVNLSSHKVAVTADYVWYYGFPDSVVLNPGATFNWDNNFDAFVSMKQAKKMYFDGEDIYLDFMKVESVRNPASSVNYEWEKIEKYLIKYTYTITESDYELAVKQTEERNREQKYFKSYQ